MKIFLANFKDALLVKHKADKVWDPSIMDSLTDEEGSKKIYCFLSLGYYYKIGVSQFRSSLVCWFVGQSR